MRFDLALVVTLVAAPVFGSVTTYTDVAAWAVSASNAPNVTFEGAIINNGQIQAPDLTISTQTMFAGQTGPGSGKAIGDLWADCVGKSGCSSGLNDTTTFTFDEPVYAFAGNWDL
jgi:hypothetical protein